MGGAGFYSPLLFAGKCVHVVEKNHNSGYFTTSFDLFGVYIARMSRSDIILICVAVGLLLLAHVLYISLKDKKSRDDIGRDRVKMPHRQSQQRA